MLQERAGFDKEMALGFVNIRAKTKRLVEEELKVIVRDGISLIPLGDAKYPPLLGKVFDPPMLLYLKGSLSEADGKGIAVVGSRKATAYGKSAAERLAGGMASRGVTVVSGMARGIDTVVHHAALAQGGRTVAVLGCGLSNCYPPDNKKLMDRITESGAVISEFSMATKPFPHHFPRRNRIISGMTYGTLVVEAAKNSGALITADFALEQGRDVFAVPGPVGGWASEGTNRLIKQGAAKLTETVEDLLDEIPAWKIAASQRVSRQASPQESRVSEEARRLYTALSVQPEHIDVLTRRSGLAIQHMSACLMELELSGLVKQFSGKLFARAS